MAQAIKFNRQETLSNIEIAFIRTIINEVSSMSYRDIENLENELYGLYDGFLYNLVDTVEDIEENNKESLTVAQYRFFDNIKTIYRDLNERLS